MFIILSNFMLERIEDFSKKLFIKQSVIPIEEFKPKTADDKILSSMAEKAIVQTDHASRYIKIATGLHVLL